MVYHVCLEGGRSWVQALVGSNQDYKIEICYSSAKHAAFERVGTRHVGSESG